jgi:2-succinyl-6-hydroxy-2,4-cyclohexadiene-1-carboxylate synthase
MNIYFIHGFLGLPEDWQALEAELRLLMPAHTQYYAVNLWDQLKGLPREKMFSAWADHFCEDLEGQDNWLIGYSMGGRLLQHIPAEAFPRVQAMSLISSHLGLEQEDEREKRIKNDLNWAQSFLEEPWKALISDWYSQKVFANDSVRTLRSENKFSRTLLAQAIDGWSLGRQKCFWEDEFPFPMSYTYGRGDKKFSAIAKKIKLRRPEIQVNSLAGGHNLHVSHPKELALQLTQFLTGKASKEILTNK